MLLFNVTVIIEEDTVDKWLKWMTDIHIPQMMATECFVSNRLLKLLDSPNEGVTYCVQYIAENESEYDRFKNHHEQLFTAEMYTTFPNKVLSFSSLMQFVA